MSASKPRTTEILAPAGDRDTLSAALAAGADAVYFGLDDGFNARARAANFASDTLPEVVAWVHRAGARAYVTLNTLVFEPELATVEELIRRVAAAGTDAIIVQDPAVALLARAICPQLDVHASTQMTASSPLAAELLRDLGISRVVVPRELSVAEIGAYAAGTTLPLEVFIHGALCVSWSGQCLSSEAWGGRSANRGQCAQACRLPYRLIVDGVEQDLGEVAYLLSPKDLVGLDAVPALAELGIASLKIEGRLKGPNYVATAVAQYRAAVAAATGAELPAMPVKIPDDEPSLHVAYSRGVTHGFLSGSNHQTLVEGRFPHHRGVPLGKIAKIDGDSVLVVPDPSHRLVTGGLAVDATPPAGDDTDKRTRVVPRAGMGVVFDRGKPREPEEGGPIFAVLDGPGAPRAGSAAAGPRGSNDAPRGHWLRFGRPGPSLAKVSVGDRVWITSDPKVTRAGEKAVEAGRGPLGRIAIDMRVYAMEGRPLEIVAMARGATVRVASTSVLAPASGAGLARSVVLDKLAALGGTPFHPGEIDTSGLMPGLHLPVSELKDLRRAIVAELTVELERVTRTVAPAPVASTLRATFPALEAPPLVVPLCRTDAQLDAVLAAGAREVELDWMELVGLGRAVERARTHGARVGIATMRVQKPGEQQIDAHLAKLQPDHILVRSWGSLAAFAERGGPALHGDFSLNVTNSITAGWVLERGLVTLTAAHDLDRDQLFALLAAAPRGRVAVTVHHHVPTFHTEHCVYAHLLSTGTDFRSCGRPCEQHEVALRDRVGLVHPVVVDVGCRNTIFNAQAQSAAGMVPELLAAGVRRLRVELVRETGEEAARVFTAYTQLAAGRLSPRDVLKKAAAHEQFGVTKGTMRTLTVLR